MNEPALSTTPADPSRAPELCAVLAGDGVFEVDGDDARSYLNGQLSSDVTAFDAQRSGLTSYSDPRGRLLAILRVLPVAPDRLSLVVSRDLVDATVTRLRKYALRAAVRIGDRREDRTCLGVAGSATTARLSTIVGELPAETDDQITTPEGLAIVRVPDDRARWLVCGPAEEIRQLADELAGEAQDTCESTWRRLDIEAGLPRIRMATAGRFVAQMVNLDCLGAVDFRKGCFPGQEVIARTRYLGRIKRRMFILQAGTDSSDLEPGAAVHRPAGDEQPVGEVVDAAPDPGHGSIALAVLRLEAAGDDLRLGAPDGPALAVRHPPYSLEDPA